MTKIAQHAFQEKKKTPQLQLCIVPYCQKVESFSRCSSFVFINLLIHLNFGGVYFVFSWVFFHFFRFLCGFFLNSQPSKNLKLCIATSTCAVVLKLQLLSSAQFSLKYYFGLISYILIYILHNCMA